MASATYTTALHLSNVQVTNRCAGTDVAGSKLHNSDCFLWLFFNFFSLLITQWNPLSIMNVTMLISSTYLESRCSQIPFSFNFSPILSVLPICNYLNILALNFILYFLSQLYSLSRDSCILSTSFSFCILFRIFVLSTNEAKVD